MIEATIREDLHNLRRDVQEIERRVQKLEIRGSDTAVECLNKVTGMQSGFDDFHDKMDCLIEKFDSIRLGGCALADVHKEAIQETKRMAKEAFDLAQKSRLDTVRSQMFQSMVTAIGTAFLLFMFNLFLKKL